MTWHDAATHFIIMNHYVPEPHSSTRLSRTIQHISLTTMAKLKIQQDESKRQLRLLGNKRKKTVLPPRSPPQKTHTRTHTSEMLIDEVRAMRAEAEAWQPYGPDIEMALRSGWLVFSEDSGSLDGVQGGGEGCQGALREGSCDWLSQYFGMYIRRQTHTDTQHTHTHAHMREAVVGLVTHTAIHTHTHERGGDLFGVYTCIHTHIHICMYVCMYIHTYIHSYIYVCM